MSASPWPWVQKLSELIPEMTAVPLFGNAPSFDWNLFSSTLASRLELPDFALKAADQGWKEADLLEQELGPNPFVASVFLNPIGASLYFSMSKTDLEQFLSWMMKTKSKLPLSEPIKEGFSRFLLLEILDAAHKMPPLQKLTPHLTAIGIIPKERAFCIDIALSNGESTCWGRIILTEPFRKKWVEHFSSMPPEYLTSPAAKSAELLASVQTGSIQISQEEWNSLQPGDFVLLDRNSYNQKKKTGIATLWVGSIPLFQVQIKKDKIEILDHFAIQEETMEEDRQEHHEEHKQEGEEFAEQAPAAQEKEFLSVREIPLNVSVELAKLRISLQELMQLNPGNVLTVPVHPDQGVSLVLNGKKIGRGELLHLGETFGIRILEIGT